jgi:hypothetical protein
MRSFFSMILLVAVTLFATIHAQCLNEIGAVFRDERTIAADIGKHAALPSTLFLMAMASNTRGRSTQSSRPGTNQQSVAALIEATAFTPSEVLERR